MKLQVASAITDALARNGMTQLELAQRAGITQSYVSQICAGKKQPTLAILTTLCDILNLEMDDLTEKGAQDDQQGARLTCRESELLECYRSMSQENQMFLTHIADTLARDTGAPENKNSGQ